MKHRSIAVAIGVALLAAACSGDDTADPTTAEESTTTSVTSTSAPSTTATSIPTTSAPPTTGVASSTSADVTVAEPTTMPSTAASTVPVGDTDWRAVVEALGRRRQELYASPDVTRIGEVCADESPCAEQLEVQLGDMAGKGWHIEGGDPYTVLEAQLEDFDGDTLETSLVVTVVGVIQRPASGGQIVDANGTVVADVSTETPEGINTRGRTFLSRVGPPEDPWRIIDQQRIGDVPA